jgi:alkylated DNA repair protein (DNA oxidative demethylase)
MTRAEPASLALFPDSTTREAIGESALVLRGFALSYVERLLPALSVIEAAAPFRHMVTPGGFTMSVALTNCGQFGWTSDLKGYRYSQLDPKTAKPWPVMPDSFDELSRAAAAAAGFGNRGFDACLINRYVPGSRLTLHQDKNERDFTAPIVSVSLGMSATFLFGGTRRRDPMLRVPLEHGDVVVWGSVDRLRFHGVMPIKDQPHWLLGRQRINFTFRQAS